MKLTCPECGASVPAANINIQKMTAVCPECGAVFQFEPPQAKAKRRKVHQPQALELRDTDETLEMVFRTNFRLSQDANFVVTSMSGVFLSFISMMMFGQSNIMSKVPVVPIAFLLMGLVSLYTAVTVAYNKTHITMDADKIRVSRKPLPGWDHDIEINLHGIDVVRCEETAISKKEGYDLPRYNVWAETPDGGRRVIVKDVTEEYAVFIAQRLNERLAQDAEGDLDLSHLADDETDEAQSGQLMNAVLDASKERLKDR